MGTKNIVDLVFSNYVSHYDITVDPNSRICRDFYSRGFSIQVSVPLTGAGKNLLKSAGFQRESKIRGKSIYYNDWIS